MIQKISYYCIFLLSSWLISMQAQADSMAIEMLGAKLPNTIILPGSKTTLVLNGYAANSMWGEEIYVAALYTERIEKKAQMLLLNDQPMAMLFYFVQDDLTSEMLDQIFIESMMANNYSMHSKPFDQTRLLELQEQLRMTLNAGDKLAFIYTPENGNVSMLLNDRVQHQWLHAKTFFNLLLKMWVGPHPPTREFKRAILNFPIE